MHLQVRGFSVFLDIEKLRAGKFDDNLLNSVRNARNFVLVLTPNSLDRCVADTDLKDWVHRVGSALLLIHVSNDSSILLFFYNYTNQICRLLTHGFA